MANEIMQYQEMFMPVMNLELAIARRSQLVNFTKGIMVEGHDYGKIPGAGDKPTLLKPGAEKLATFFGLTPVFILSDHTEDWTGEKHGGEAFFNYRYKCELWRTGNLLATAEASCNSRESKYRYRKSERVCPQCGQAAIIKGKADYGGGWVCFKKRGGCGTNFQDNDPAIIEQQTGRIPNPDVADQVNTIQKMSQKRAFIAAILLGVNASEFYTQDIEDLAGEAVDATYRVVEPAQEQRTNGKPHSAQATNGNGTQCSHCNAPAGKPHGKSCPNAQAVAASQPTPQPQPVTQAPPANEAADPDPQLWQQNKQPADVVSHSDVQGKFHGSGNATFSPQAWDEMRGAICIAYGVESSKDLPDTTLSLLSESFKANRRQWQAWQRGSGEMPVVTNEQLTPA